MTPDEVVAALTAEKAAWDAYGHALGNPDLTIVAVQEFRNAALAASDVFTIAAEKEIR